MKSIFFFLFTVLFVLSCSESPVKADPYIMQFTLRDYNYVKNRYFFVSDYYRDEFESSYSDDLKHFIYSVDKKL